MRNKRMLAVAVILLFLSTIFLDYEKNSVAPGRKVFYTEISASQPPSKILPAARLTSPQKAIEEKEFFSYLSSTNIGPDASNEDLFFLSTAVLNIPVLYDDLPTNAHLPIKEAVFSEIKARIPNIQTDKYESLYLFDSYISFCVDTLQRGNKLPDDYIQVSDKIAESLISSCLKSNYDTEYIYCAFAGLTLQKYAYYIGGKDAPLYIQCQNIVNKGLNNLLAKSDLSMGVPVWYDESGKITIKNQALSLYVLGRYNFYQQGETDDKTSNGQSYQKMELPFIEMQVEGALDLCTQARFGVEATDLYFEYCCWLNSSKIPEYENPQALQEHVAMLSMASMISGTGAHSYSAVKALLKDYDISSPSSLAAASLYVFPPKKAIFPLIVELSGGVW